MKARWRHVVLAASVSAVAVLPATAAAGGPPGVSDTAQLRKGMSAWGILGHETALQAIATRHEGTRVSGTPGYDASARYVADKARRAGLTVTRQEFTYPYGFPLGETVQPKLQTWGPGGFESYDAGIIGALFGGDYGVAIASGSGDEVGELWAVDLVLPPGAPNASTSGCEPEDFAGMPRGSIALMQRGTCGFAVRWRTPRPRAPMRRSSSTRASPDATARCSPTWGRTP